MTPPRSRARSDADKRRRERAILDAARELATASSVREVTLTGIAERVGLHKSAMLRYFESREQIFLDLMAEAWQEWDRAARAALSEQAPATDEAIAGALTATLVERPLFCDLLAQTPLNLERNAGPDAVVRFKVVAIDAARSVGAALAEAAGLDVDAGHEIVAATTALAGALWQMAAPGTELRALYEQRPELAHAVVDVGPRLTRLVTALLRGSR